jgi:hypothetical protein
MRVLLRKNQHIVRCRLHNAGVGRDRQPPIENNPKEWPAPRKPAAICEKRVIGLHSADAGEHGVCGVAHPVNFHAGFFRANPVCPFLIPISLAQRVSLTRKSELAIERKRGFQRHEWFFRANPASERFVQFASLLFTYSCEDFDPGST